MKTEYLLKRKEGLEFCEEVEYFNELKNRNETLFYKTSSRRFEQLKKKYCEIPKGRKMIFKEGYVDERDENIIRRATPKEVKRRDFYFYSRFPVSKN